MALYTIAGSYTLMHVLAHYALHTDYLFNIGAAGFVGAVLVSRFSDGDSLRETLLASVVIVIGVSILSILPNRRQLMEQATTYTLLLSSLLVAMTAALAGTRVGAAWAQRAAYQSRAIMGAVLAAVVLVGAFACHLGVIAVFEEASHGLAIFLILLSIVLTPAFAGAALQLSQADSVERQMGSGIALIAAAFLILLGWQLRSPGTVFLISIGFLGVGATIYTVTLPGVLTVRSSRFWSHRCNDVPVATAIVAKDSQVAMAVIAKDFP